MCRQRKPVYPHDPWSDLHVAAEPARTDIQAESVVFLLWIEPLSQFSWVLRCPRLCARWAKKTRPRGAYERLDEGPFSGSEQYLAMTDGD